MTEFLLLDDYTVPGFGLKVSGEMEMRTEDLSGESSGTARADKGIKPKKLNVTLGLAFANATQLQELILVASAKDENGQSKVYTITNREANVGGVRQVRFTDRISWTPQGGLQVWNVSFTLREHLSVPEKAEARIKKVKATAQTNAGQTVQVEPEPTTVPDSTISEYVPEPPKSMVEKVFSVIDNLLRESDED